MKGKALLKMSPSVAIIVIKRELIPVLFTGRKERRSSANGSQITRIWGSSDSLRE